MTDDPTGEADAPGAELAARDAPPPREPILSQAEIDSAIGWEPARPEPAPAGLRGMVDARAAPREALPMFSVVFDAFVGQLGGSLRKLFGGDVTLSVASMGPVRYGDFIEDTILPAQLVTFKAEGWDGEGLVAFGPHFAQLVFDLLLGAGRGHQGGRISSRPFSAIESALLTRIADLVLAETETAFAELRPVSMRRERVESDPRLANVARPGDAALAATLSVSCDGRSAEFAMLWPYAMLEPIRGQLRESVLGVKLGRDDYWTSHLATEMWQARIEAEAVLHETSLPLGRVLDLAVGDTLMFEMSPTDPVEIRAGGRPLTRGRIGRVDGRIAVQITEPLQRPATSGLGVLSP